ncbi:MarR family transcriptional regulator [Clostridium perfringens]|uniref:MarR family transcriptional regulator n=1 Tax=Clostridium perfringens TaxID=1502 RepID=UPI0039EBCA27
MADKEVLSEKKLMFFQEFTDNVRDIFNDDIVKYNVLSWIIFNTNYSQEYKGLKARECYFSYSILEEKLNVTRYKLQRIMKELINEGFIEWVSKSKSKGESSILKLNFQYGLEYGCQYGFQYGSYTENTGFNENNNTVDNTVDNTDNHTLSKKHISKKQSKNINNIYSPLENELYYDEVNKNLEKDLIKRINSKYPKDLIKEEFEKLKEIGLSELDLLKELDKNLKSKSKVKKDKYSEDSKEYKLSILLRDLILRRDENSRCRNADMQKWSKEIDLLYRKDNRSYEDIEKIIRWCQQDTFWKANILSTHKLRDKFDSLYQKAFCENKSYNKNNFKNDNSERSNDTDGECWYFKDSL